MPVFHIDDHGDPRLEPFRDIRDRDVARRARLFIAEGDVVLRTLVTRSPFAVESILLGEAQAGRLASGLPGDLPVYVVPRLVMDRVAGFPIHRGILAAGRRGPPAAIADLLSGLQGPALVVGLVGLANHDNVGGVFRNAAAFGVDAVMLDQRSCDPLYRKAIRVSVGASLTVPFAHGGSAEAMLACLTEAGFDILALAPGASDTLAAHVWRPRTALLFGSEGAGLPAALLASTRPVAIPMAGGFDSLNVATTSGIALHEARRERTHLHEEGPPRGTALPLSSAVTRP